jgi:head-tail adaptor
MRYTGEAKKGERQEALQSLKGLWGKVRGAVGPNREP